MIHDKFDPSGQGMFSKSGRQSGDVRTMLERVISSQTAHNKRQGGYQENSMNPYSNILEDITGGQKDNKSLRPYSANAYQQNEKNNLYEYSVMVKQKMQNALSIEPFAKQITREQFNKSYTQKYYGKNQNKVQIISEQSDPHKKKPKFVWDILKIYKSQKKSRQQSQAKDETMKQKNSQYKLGQPLTINEFSNNADNKPIFNRTFNNDSPSKGMRDSQISPSQIRSSCQQRVSISRDTQMSSNKFKIDPKNMEMKDIDLSSSKSPSKERNLFISEVPVYPERLKTKVAGFTDFKRQMNRSKDSYHKFYKVNESRFELLKESSVSSNVKHSRDYSFNKQLNREVVSAFKPDEKIPDNGYKPNFEVTKRSLGRVGPCFNKLSPHKSLENKLVGVFQGVHYEYDDWVKSRNRNSNVFKKQLSREKNPNHALPGYMQNVRSRISLQDLSQKMLEENSYMDQKFLNMNSVFSTKSSMSRQSTKSITQQNFFRSASLMRSPSTHKERVKTSNSSMHKNQRTQQSLQNNLSGQITNNSFYY